MKQVAWWAMLALVSGLAQAESESDPLLESVTSTASEVRGVLRARSQAVLASDLPGRATEISWADGEASHEVELRLR